jgi:hypothetical protein
MLQKIKLTGVIICIIALITTYSSCCKPAPCIAFSADELAWVPYKDGDSIFLKSNLTGRKYILIAQKVHETTEPTHDCAEGQNYCDNYLEMYLKSTDTLALGFSLNNTNNYNDKKKKYYTAWFIIENIQVDISNKNASNLQTKIINGVSYSNVVFLKGINIYDTIYYAKSFGVLAYHKIGTNEWLYKQ